MPELPEVENFARVLGQRYAGRQVVEVIYRRPDLRFPFDPGLLSRAGLQKGSCLRDVDRRGKQLRLRFDRGDVYISLGMSGSFIPADPQRPSLHEHLTIVFSGKDTALGYVDPRRFGFVTTRPPPDAVDPLRPEDLGQELKRLAAAGCKRRLRDVLLDQSIVAGVGNIYMCEACFRARVNPLAPLSAIRPKPLWHLCRELSLVLHKAIEMGGSSIATYRRYGGEKGGFQDLHVVYAREGEVCRRVRCRGIIERQVCGGRGVFLCPRCQKV